METIKISIFDWNGSLEKDLQLDAENFDISILTTEGHMGFVIAEITGSSDKIQKFLDYYDLCDEEDDFGPSFPNECQG